MSSASMARLAWRWSASAQPPPHACTRLKMCQSRFGSVIVDEDHLTAAARTVALNPVRARLVERAEDWPWSSVRAHLEGRDDGLVDVAPLLSRAAGRFTDLLEDEPDAQRAAALRSAEDIGRPLGSAAFLDRVAQLIGRDPRPGKPGRRRKLAAAESIVN